MTTNDMTRSCRAPALLLALLCALSLCACANGSETDLPSESATGQAASEEETADLRYECELPELNFNDEEIHVLYADKVGRSDELPAEKMGLGVVSDAIYERNQLVENMLKVKLDYIPEFESSVATVQNKDVQGGTGSYDIVVNGVYMAISPATQGKYIDLTPLENVDTSKHYWSQGFNEISFFTSENRQYLATGDAALSTYRLMFMTIYNKTLFENNHEKDLYEVIKNGEWTLDYQLRILDGHYVDTDGNNKRSRGDSFGFLTGTCVSTDPYLTAGNARLIVRDEELGELAYCDDSEKLLYDLVEKVHNIYQNEATYLFLGSGEDDVGLSFITETFAEGRSMMATIIFWNMEHSFNELAQLSYGIAPMPKLSVDQKKYYSYVQDQVSTFGICASVKNEDRREMCAAVLEAIMYHSHRLVIPAYYEITLSYRYMQDPESKEILEIVCDSQAFDFASECCGLVGSTRALFASKSNTTASSTKNWKRMLTQQVDKYNKAIDKIKQ